MNTQYVRIGLIGYGRWGFNYARVIASLSGVSVYAVATKSRRDIGFDPAFQTQNWRELLDLEELDGIVVACSPELHYEIASSFLKKGLPVLVEKPPCFKTSHCMHLKRIALENDVPCLIGYTHLYSSAYRSLKSIFRENSLPLNISSVGLSGGPFREMTSVLWDWGSHEVSMCLDFLDEIPCDIAVRLENNDIEKNNASIYSLNLEFPSGSSFFGFFGNISKIKERTFSVQIGKEKWCYDGLIQSVSCVTNKTSEYSNTVFDSFPLTNLVNEFADVIRNNAKYHHSLDLAIKVTDILSFAENKLKDQ